MYYCKDCGEVFSEPETKTETWYEEVWGAMQPFSETICKCPHCGSEDIDDAVSCDNCGEYFNPNDLDENCYCKACAEELTFWQ